MLFPNRDQRHGDYRAARRGGPVLKRKHYCAEWILCIPNGKYSRTAADAPGAGPNDGRAADERIGSRIGQYVST